MKGLQTFKTGIIDRYIIRKFLGTFFFAMLLIIVITVVFDISEKIDDFIEKKAPFKAIIFDYYFNFIPYFISLFSSLFIFISVIFFTSKMAYQSEIIAILSSGISFRRFLYPYFIGACILALFSFVVNDVIIPPANKHRLEFEDKYVKTPVVYLERNVHKQVEPGLFVYLESFSNSSETAYRFALERYRGDRMASKLMSASAVWNKEKEKWTIRDYHIRDIDSLGHETLRTGASIDTTLNLDPSEFKRRDNFMETMNIIQLKDFIDDLKMQGADNVKMFVIELNRRIASPFSTFILTLIGVSLSTRKVRGGIGIHVAIGIAISFLYILFMQFSSEFATKGSLHPVLAAWVPNIIFGIVGIFLYRLAPK
ncbi:MAG: LptF/LptG family permease [Bacteroidales bacterium]|jgi:lipopolysaccharide export system permease protein|nr:LptF/LptG family permease [Bacteroidales bacterium]